MSLREYLRRAMPATLVHRYRMLRHVTLFPFEPEIQHIQRFLEADAAAIDVGAHCGLYTQVLSRYSRHIIAVEPSPQCAAYLRQLGIPNCTVVEAALSQCDGHGMLRIPTFGGTHDIGRSTIAAENLLEEAEAISTIVVTLKTLDSVVLEKLNRDDRVCFIKIDVEGHEMSVLSGAEQTMQRHRPAIMVEIELRHGADIHRVFSRMTELNYTPHALVDGKLREVTAEQLLAMQKLKVGDHGFANMRSIDYVRNIFFIPD